MDTMTVKKRDLILVWDNLLNYLFNIICTNSFFNMLIKSLKKCINLAY